MAKRAISIILTDPAERKMVEDFMALAYAELRRASAAQTELNKRSEILVMDLMERHGVPKDVEMYVNTDQHANHGLLFLTSLSYAADEVPSVSAGRVLN